MSPQSFTARAAACMAAALFCVVCASTIRAQDLVETAPVWDSIAVDRGEALKRGDAAGSPPSIDPERHFLLTYEFDDIEQIAAGYRSSGMRWFYERHTPELLGQFLDSTMVPLIKYSFGWHRNPVMTSQAALAFYNGYLDTGSEEYRQIFLTNADWLVENHQDYYLRYDFNWNHGGESMPKGWVSAMAQGEALAAVSSAYHLTGEQKYLDAAAGFFRTMHQNNDSTWTFVVDEQGYYWLEEYPTRDTCHVLSGLLFGLWEYYVISDDPFALELFSAGLRTVADNYPIWNITDRNESKYCLHNLKYDFYHETHLRQFANYLTYFDIPEFEAAAELFTAHPIIAASHETVEFGHVLLDSSKEDTVIFYNEGAADLKITSITTGNTDFHVNGRAVTISPGDSMAFPVVFSPSRTGQYSSYVRATSNAPSLTVGLSGRGVERLLTTEDEEARFGDIAALAEKGLLSDSLEIISSISVQPIRLAVSAEVTTGVSAEIGGDIPEEYGLDQNYPNPFSATTRLRYHLPRQSQVRLEIVNVIEQVVRTLVDGGRPAGTHDVEIDLRDFPGGIYFCRMAADSYTNNS